MAARLSTHASHWSMRRHSLWITVIFLLGACDRVVRRRRRHHLSRSSSPDIYLPPDSKVSRGLVPRNSTLEQMLLEQGLQAEVVQRHCGGQDGVRSASTAVVAAICARAVFGRRPAPVRYEIDTSSFLRVKNLSDGVELHAEVVPIPTTLIRVSVTGSIDDNTPSLFQSIDAVGEQPELAIAMAQIFGVRSISTPSCSPAIATPSPSSGWSATVGRPHTGRLQRLSFKTTDERCARSDSLPRRPARLLRSGRTLTTTVFPALSTQVRAASDVRLLGAADAPGAPRARTVVSTTALP